MGGARGVTIGYVQDLTVGRRLGVVGRPLGTNRSGVEQWWIDRRSVLKEAAKVVTGAEMATVTAPATEAKRMTEGEWEDPPVT